MERFESVIDDVKDMGVLVYADPVENAHKLEILVKSGDQEYLYRFIGPGVRNANIPMFDDRLDLAKENEKLIKAREYLQAEVKRLREKYESDNQPITRADILDQAKKCVCGQREQDYGTPESNFQLIADLWNGYLGLCENGDGVPIFSIKSITPIDVAMMMALMKIARIRNSGGSGDSFVDLAGYAACGGEIWDERHKDK